MLALDDARGSIRLSDVFIVARTFQSTGIINFRKSRSAEDVMNDWSSDMQRLLGLVEKTWMGVNAAQAAQSRALKAAS